MVLSELVAKATIPFKVTPVMLARMPWPISANDYWRTRIVFPKGGAKPFINTYVTAEAVTFKESVGWLVRQARIHSVIKGRVQLDIRLLPNHPKDAKTRMRKHGMEWDTTVGRVDLDNARKVLTDALKGVAIEDDFWIWRDYGEVLEPVEGEDKCLIVQLARLERIGPKQESLELPPHPHEVLPL